MRRGVGRKYEDRFNSAVFCEHCDGAHSRLSRLDFNRGRICPVCDDVVDEQMKEAEAEAAVICHRCEREWPGPADGKCQHCGAEGGIEDHVVKS